MNRSRTRVVLLALALVLALAPAAMAQGVGLGVTAGPVDPANGFPAYYIDSNGLSLMPCLDPAICPLPLAGEEPNFNPANPVVFPGNFPSELFYWMATPVNFTGTGAANIKVIEFALEGAFGPEVISDEQIVFARRRFRILDLPAAAIGTTVTVMHPFGTDIFTVVDDLQGGGEVNETFDRGIVPRFLGVANAINIGPFLTANPLPLPADGTIGGAGQAVVNGPNGNSVTVIGPFINVTTSQWDVFGKVFTPGADRSEAMVRFTDFPTVGAGAIDLFVVASGATEVVVSGVTDILQTGVDTFPLVQDVNHPSIFSAQIPLVGTEPLPLPTQVAFIVSGVTQEPVPLVLPPERTGAGTGVTPGAIDPANGFPAFYVDSNGLILRPCLDANNPACGLVGIDPLQPISFPNNFPDEFVYWSALPIFTGTGADNIKVIEFMLEGAFGAGPVEPGEQVTFARARFRIQDLPPETVTVPPTTITITHPYGTQTFTVVDDGKGNGEVNETFDWGIVDQFVGVVRAKNIGPFLTLADGSITGTGPVINGPNGNIVTVKGAGLDLTATEWDLLVADPVPVLVPRALLNVNAAGAGTLDLFIVAPAATTTVDVVGQPTPLPNVQEPFQLTANPGDLFTGQIVLTGNQPPAIAALVAALAAGETLPTSVVFTIDRNLPTEQVLPAVPLETAPPPGGGGAVNPPVTPGAGTGDGTGGTGAGTVGVAGGSSGCFISSLF